MLYCVIVILASCYMVHTQKRRPPSGSPRRVAVGVLPYSLQDRRKLRKDLREGSPTKGKPFCAVCLFLVPVTGLFFLSVIKYPFNFKKSILGQNTRFPFRDPPGGSFVPFSDDV